MCMLIKKHTKDTKNIIHGSKSFTGNQSNHQTNNIIIATTEINIPIVLHVIDKFLISSSEKKIARNRTMIVDVNKNCAIVDTVSPLAPSSNILEYPFAPIPNKQQKIIKQIIEKPNIIKI